MAKERISCFARITRKIQRAVQSPNSGNESNDNEKTTQDINQSLDPVVLHSSILREFVAPPWYLIKTYQGPINTTIWEDTKGKPELTHKQKKRLGGWIRLFKEGQNIKFFNGKPNSNKIKQGFVADCSFLAALAAIADYEWKHSTPMLTNIIKWVKRGDAGYSKFGLTLPFGELASETENPQIAIAVKLNFNGAPRCVLVDDWVPVRSDGRLLCAHSTDKDECWVTILEKAFVKLNGGRYNVRGTNPGIDTYHLTGWIPDIISLPQTACKNVNNYEHEVLPEKWNDMWDVLYAGFCAGSCVVALGTSDIEDAGISDKDSIEGISASSGIVSNHAYSVLDIKDVLIANKPRARMMYLKNPWGTVSWTKKFSPRDQDSWTKEMKQILHYNPNPTQDNGLFWIEWNDVLSWFSHLYISWKPNIFKNKITMHQIWKPDYRFIKSMVQDDMHLSLFNPQFNLSVSFQNHNSATVWLLLIQHRQHSDDPHKYLAMHVFSRKDVVVCPTLPDVQGIYSNGECILVKLLLKRTSASQTTTKHKLNGKPIQTYVSGDDTGVLVLVSSYAKKLTEDAPLTIRAMSSRPVQLTSMPCLVKPHWHSTIIHGKWTDANAGGSPNNIWNYFINPHYRLLFEDLGEAVILLETSGNVSVNLRIFSGRIATIRTLKSDQVISSNDYKLQCCSIHRMFKGGQYVLIPSTFRPSDRAHFRIVVYSAKKCIVQPMPYPQYGSQDNKEMYTQRVDMHEPIHIQVKIPTLLAIRIEIPPIIFSDFFVLLASAHAATYPSQKNIECNFNYNDNTYCLSTSCTHCGGPSSRFRRVNDNDKSAEQTGNYDLVLYSDLNGGLSKNGRTPSASARYLFETQRVINFTLVELLPSEVPYRLTALRCPTRGNVTFTSNQPIVIS
ncbi:Calpain-7 [Babesia sp. Xinjiang]|uniref:Calpain-7 n=1 Tax=Babesia sp. Xinjiang TaxID=462227 RepID=UPI000A24D198|nr:Calpain-7 [Babesia sp. Xinjiang]ORM40191.1 Calpain-7 [Babesia sp. Xinjiang]